MLALPAPALTAAHAIHYGYPLSLFLWFAISQMVSVCALQNLRTASNPRRRFVFVWMQLVLIASYIVGALLLILRTLLVKGWWSSQDDVIYHLSAILVWGVVQIAIVDNQRPVWYPYIGCWLLTFLAETALVGLSATSALKAERRSFEFAGFLVRLARPLIAVSFPCLVWWADHRDAPEIAQDDEEGASLLQAENSQPDAQGYGSTGNSATSSENGEGSEAARAKLREKLEQSGNWWTYVKSFSIFWKFLWPKKHSLQISVVVVGGFLLLERGLKVLVPRQLGIVTNALSESHGTIPWLQVMLFVLYRWLDSGSGISALRSYIWLPVEQYSYREITTAAYDHVMSLSYDFHSNKKTGDIWMSISQGRAMTAAVEMIYFYLVPMIIDLFVAFGYLFYLFNAYMSLIVAAVSITYLWATAKLGAMRNDVRRELNNALRNETSIMVETVSSWTTVSYFNRVPYEQQRYAAAIDKYQSSARRWQIGISLVQVTQSLIFTLGLLAACFLAVYEVSSGQKPVGSFVTLLIYWSQLSGPLVFFSGFYRRMQTYMLDAERLLELFQTQPAVVDSPNAKELKEVRGDIVFDQVGFSYNSRKAALENVSFHAPAGSTVALVGETGGGKTTCLRLLFRFYDVSAGSILIDGHDIRDVKLTSLRDHMGVVPQDPQLFNDTIMNNLRYANLDATDEEVYEACRAASVHDKILSFPDGYESKVGERGVRLSGGELQRVAIARAILRNSRIIIMDEATSNIDMETEREIQAALTKLSENRTMLVIAHRLSTIMNADLIIVIKDGAIIERGTHKTLLAAGGKYSRLWSKQLRNEAGPQKTNPSSPDEDPELLSASGIHGEDAIVEGLQKPNGASKGTRGPGSPAATNGHLQEVSDEDEPYRSSRDTDSSVVNMSSDVLFLKSNGTTKLSPRGIGSKENDANGVPPYHELRASSPLTNTTQAHLNIGRPKTASENDACQESAGLHRDQGNVCPQSFDSSVGSEDASQRPEGRDGVTTDRKRRRCYRKKRNRTTGQ